MPKEKRTLTEFTPFTMSENNTPCEIVIDTRKSTNKQLDFFAKYNFEKQLRDPERIKPALQRTLSRIVFLTAKHYTKPQYNFYLRAENCQGALNLPDLSLSETKSYVCNHKQGREAFGIISESTYENHLKKLMVGA